MGPEFTRASACLDAVLCCATEIYFGATTPLFTNEVGHTTLNVGEFFSAKSNFCYWVSYFYRKSCLFKRLVSLALRISSAWIKKQFLRVFKTRISQLFLMRSRFLRKEALMNLGKFFRGHRHARSSYSPLRLDKEK